MIYCFMLSFWTQEKSIGRDKAAGFMFIFLKHKSSVASGVLDEKEKTFFGWTIFR